MVPAGAGAGGAAVGVAVGALSLKAGQESAEAVLEAVRRFLILQRAREQAWAVRELRGRASQQDVLDALAREDMLGAEFQRRVLSRVSTDVRKALNLPEDQRHAAIEALLKRERRYAVQRSQAAAVRIAAAVNEAQLRRLPAPPGGTYAGAFWRLDPTVQQHTEDCLAMAGRFWPWEALSVLRPPTHAGCRCSLHSWEDAVARGWLRRDHEWLPISDMVRKANAAAALLHEGEERDLVEALVRTGVCSRVRAVRAFMAAT